MLTLFLFTIVLQISPSAHAKQPVIQENEKPTVTDTRQQSVTNKPSDPSTVGHSDGAQKPPEETNPGQAPPNERIYKVNVVSQPNQPRDPWFIASVIASLLLVVAAGGTLVILWRQTNEISKQVTSLMNSERAWIMVDVDTLVANDPLHRRGAIVINKNSDGIETTNVRFHFNCRNQGRSPAWIIEKRIKLWVFEANKIPENPPFFVLGANSFQDDLVSMIAGKEFPCIAEVECTGQIQDRQVTCSPKFSPAKS